MTFLSENEMAIVSNPVRGSGYCFPGYYTVTLKQFPSEIKPVFITHLTSINHQCICLVCLIEHLAYIKVLEEINNNSNWFRGDFYKRFIFFYLFYCRINPSNLDGGHPSKY